MEDHKEIAELLITKGADVNAKNRGGSSVLDYATRLGQPETADLIRKHGGKTKKELEGGEPVAEAAKPEPPTAEAPDISIHDAARYGNIEAIKQQLADGADVNAKNKYEWTPLYLAANEGHKEVVELLIDNGADVNAKNNRGRTALDLASGKTADLLRKHGGKTGEELKAEEK